MRATVWSRLDAIFWFGLATLLISVGDNIPPAVCFREALVLQSPLTIGWNLAEYNTVYARARSLIRNMGA